MTYAFDYETRLDDARAEFAGEEIDRIRERRDRRWCPTCRHYGHAHGCPEAPEQPSDDDLERVFQ